ncbi:hypothetical protein CANARDRAFT_192551 [[Candida] arabinofermentans NRRL YB-2248]|uniref:Uncharacterized protein n=1 Tax=[Candida] arabinofermentans NRRL YB-2248 TaxID=983967 RepID=A0A1E4SZF3_9ASCO|nr:hypothetical protein CANARDRAFT_192551 [[Candida] arabinofermentans NRRL YB-2248]
MLSSTMTHLLVHPLALLNISDSLYRAKVHCDESNLTSNEREAYIDQHHRIGGLLGVHNLENGSFSVAMSFNIICNESGVIDVDELLSKLKLNDEIYSHLEFVGFYMISSADDSDLSSNYGQVYVGIVEQASKQLLEHNIFKNGWIYMKIHESLEFKNDDLKNSSVLPIQAKEYQINSTTTPIDVHSIEIKSLQVENITLNTINQTTDDITEKIVDKQNLFTDVKSSVENSIENLELRLDNLISFLDSCKIVGSSKVYQDIQTFEMLQSIGELIVKIDTIKSLKSTTNNDIEKSTKLALVNEALTMEIVRKLDSLGVVHNKISM